MSNNSASGLVIGLMALIVAGCDSSGGGSGSDVSGTNPDAEAPLIDADVPEGTPVDLDIVEVDIVEVDIVEVDIVEGDIVEGDGAPPKQGETAPSCPPNAICTCKEGYAGDGVLCEDIDECATGTADCHDHATCGNTVGSYLCNCTSGYQGDGFTCEDIDECAQDSYECEEGTVCVNLDGGYECEQVSMITCWPGTWSPLLSEDFDDGVADGWTTCTGCAGFGCPSASGGVYRFNGDWNRGCMPVAHGTAKGIAFEFDLHRQAPMNVITVSAGWSDASGDWQKWQVGFDGADVKIYRKDHGEEVFSGVLPGQPLDAHVRVELDLEDGRTCVWSGETFVGEYTAPPPQIFTPWMVHAYGDGAGANSYIDNMKVEIR